MQSFYMRTTKTLVRSHGCVGWFEASLEAHVRRYVYSRCGIKYQLALVYVWNGYILFADYKHCRFVL